MLSPIERVKNILSKITYKPGWTFYVDREDKNTYKYSSYLKLHVIAQQIDISDPLKIVYIKSDMMISEWDIERLSDNQLIDYLVLQLIRKVELHEIDEWLKIDGINFREPHPELKEKVSA